MQQRIARSMIPSQSLEYFFFTQAPHSLRNSRPRIPPCLNRKIRAFLRILACIPFISVREGEMSDHILKLFRETGKCFEESLLGVTDKERRKISNESLNSLVIEFGFFSSRFSYDMMTNYLRIMRISDAVIIYLGR